MRVAKFILIFFVFFLLYGCASTAVKNADQVTGLTAQDFTLPDQDGKEWKLSDTVKDYHAVILAFYAKDDTKL